MSHSPSFLSLRCLGVVLLALGCHTPVPDAASPSDPGSGQLALQIAPGVALDVATFTVTGPAGFSRTGTLDLSHSSTLTANLGGLPAGSGYQIVVSAAAPGLTCTGSASFAVMARATTSVVVHLLCREAPRNGSATVTGTVNICPVVDQLSALPSEVVVGASLGLSASAHDTDQAPQPLGYSWTAASGTFSDSSAPAPAFTCTVAGPVAITVTVSDGDCTDALTTSVTCSPAAVFSVAATVETDPVPHTGDAADDPAIWVNPLDPALSTIIGTDKAAGGGLGVYDLSGHQIQFLVAGALNNVDLRDGFSLGGQTVTLVTAGNRSNNSIAIFAVDPVTRLLTDVAARTITTLATYGSCMYRSAIDGKFYYFVDSKLGEIEQWELFDDGNGRVDARKVRNLRQLATQPEACVADDELGLFYIGEEDIGIWKFAAEPGGDPMEPLAQGVLVDSTGPGGHLIADVEGLAIARTGAGTGYLIAANQGDSSYAMYTREGANTYLKTFRIGMGPACIDEVTGSDGIDVTTAALGPAFPGGVFVTQDDTNTPSGNQNFKLVPWQDIAGGPGASVPACVPADASSDGGAGDASSTDAEMPAPEAGAGFPPDFCAAFCGKCSTCWNPTGGFSEGDCLYQLAKPNFTVDDCLAGCAAGRTPGFPPVNLPMGWEAMACLDFDNAI